MKFPRSIFLGVLGLLMACNAQQVKKTTPLYLGYHDLTAHYNGYFNAKLILNETLARKQAEYVDDYNRLLPLNITTNLKPESSDYPELDRAIKKASVAIRLHGNSKWTDDCYFIIGLCRFYKGEYDEAVKTFQVITSDFSNGLRPYGGKKKKKKSNRGKKKNSEVGNPYYDGPLAFFRHKPVKWEAMLWMARSYIMEDKFLEAQTILTYANGDKQFPDKLRETLYQITTELFIRQKNYEAAAASLQQTIAFAGKKSDITRYEFIHAQLQALSGLYNEAIASYNHVLELSPGYEMEFYTRLNIADLSRQTNAASKEDILEMLGQMLRNEKYEEFHGQIYFSMAEIYLSEGAVKTAAEYYNKALRLSEPRSPVIPNAYSRLADLYFEQDNYVKSQAYHDSTLAVMDQENPQYDALAKRNRILKDMVAQIQIIKLEDSLQYLAQLTPAEREALLEKIKEESSSGQEEETGQPLNGFENLPSQTASSWPFDNVEAKSRGFSIFRSTWGNRALEDNWRRSARNNISFNNGENDQNNGNVSIGQDVDPETFFANVPLTDSAMAISNQHMMEAYYNLARIYRDRLENDQKAAETFETMLNRFPDNPHLLEVYYSLYLLYKDRKPEKNEYYEQKILEEFPESLFAKVLLNPDYIEQSQEQQDEITDYYAETYHLFESGQLEEVMNRVQMADSLFDPNPMKPKFDMLYALSLGKMDSMEAFRTALQDIVNKYPGTEVHSKAIDILNAMEGTEYSKEEIGEDKLAPYTVDPEAEHYLVILFYHIGKDIDQVKNNLSNYNMKYHSLDNFQISSVLLNENQQMVIVKSLKNGQKALAYYNEIRYNQPIFEGIDPESYTIFFTTVRNYGVFFREKDISAYLKFFSENYLGGGN